ncbi:MAG: hypothetical protein PHF20_07975 [Halothiobacillaceae bacterium]|nr:hypothetical protein [Halothiobacillaceae bacterium]
MKETLDRLLNVWLVIIACHIGLLGLVTFGAIVHAEELKVVKAHVELIDTGLTRAVPTYFLWGFPSGIWIDDNRIAIDAALQNGTKEEKLRFGSVVLYDLRTGQSKEIEPKADPISWDETTREFVVSHIGANGPHAITPPPATLLQLDDNGDVLSRTLLQRSWFSLESIAEREKIPLEIAKKWVAILKGGNGYIESGKRNEAILHKPDGTIKALGISTDVIFQNRHLPFANRYQLKNPQCHEASRALHAEAMCEPLYLMSPEGDIETINFPEYLRDGLGQFDFTYAVKNGVLIRVRYPGKQGYYLWRNNVLYELWRSREGGFFNMFPYEFWGGEAIAPDGCKVAFFKARDSKSDTPRKIFIFNLCGIGS